MKQHALKRIVAYAFDTTVWLTLVLPRLAKLPRPEEGRFDSIWATWASSAEACSPVKGTFLPD